MNLKIIVILFLISISSLFSQNESGNKVELEEKSNKTEGVTAINDKIEFQNSKGNPIITITDEGFNAGSITIPQSTPSATINKLYNEGGTLKFNGTTIGSGGVDSLNQLVDVEFKGFSLFLGEGSGANDDGTDNYNLGSGFNALLSNTSGGGNTALGTSSLISNLTGNENAAVGLAALNTNQSGNQNTAIGAYAGVNETGPANITGNVFLGYKAGYNFVGDNKLFINNDESSSPLIWGDFTDGSEEVRINGNFHVTGNITTEGTLTGLAEINDLSDAKYSGFNLFLGEGAGDNDNDTDNYNVGTGFNALKSNTSGDGNTAYGTSSLISNISGNENVGVGLAALNTNQNGSKNTALGAYAGLNEIGPANITGNVFLGYKAGYNFVGDNKLFINNDESNSPLIWGDFANDRIVINGNSTNNTSNRTFFSNGEAGGTSAWFNDSDAKLKENIKTIASALNKVKQLRGVNYEWKDKEKYSDSKQIGFIAQEVDKVIPEVVDKTNDHYSMQYAPLTALLVEAVKELEQQISELRINNSEIISQNEKLEKRIIQMEKILNKQSFVNANITN